MNFRRTITILLSVSLPILHLQAQSCEVGPAQNSIRTLGKAVVAVQPNYVVINLTVETQNLSLRLSKEENDQRLGTVLKQAKAYGLPEQDIAVQFVDIEKHYRYEQGMTLASRFDGFIVHRDIQLTLRDLKKYEALLNASLENGATGLNGVDFRHTENRKFQDQARESAIKAARQKAISMAGANGQKIGVALKIDEEGEKTSWYKSQSRQEHTGIENSYIVSAGTETGETAPGAGTITFSASVCVAFQLE